MSHPFQRGVRGRDESPFQKRGGVTEISKGEIREGGGVYQSQPRGGGGGQIMLRCPHSGYTSTDFTMV